MKSVLFSAIALPVTALAFATAASAQSTNSGNAPAERPPVFTAPSNQAPPRAAPDMQRVLDALGRLGAKPIHTQSPAEVRAGPTPADAVKAVMEQRGMSTAPDGRVTTRDLTYGSDPWQKARIYRPAAAPRGRPLPLIVYYHGGGWVIADLDVYDSTPRMLAEKTGALVVSVEYRHAPEAKFPAQHDDANMAYRWALQNARGWGANPNRLALVGESAGGNLAINVAMMARDSGLAQPRHIVAVYPIANARTDLPSRMTGANAKPLSTPDLPWFGYYYGRSPADQQDPRINLVRANLRGLPPVTIVSAQIDPLLSDGNTLAAALRRAGVAVDQRLFVGVTHEFFGMGKVVAGARQANAYAVARLAPALAPRGR